MYWTFHKPHPQTSSSTPLHGQRPPRPRAKESSFYLITSIFPRQHPHQAIIALPKNSLRHHQRQLQDRQFILPQNRTTPGHIFTWAPIQLFPLQIRHQLHPRPPSQKLASLGDNYSLKDIPLTPTPEWCIPHSPHPQQQVLPHHARAFRK